jgi:hypothetical protein
VGRNTPRGLIIAASLAVIGLLAVLGVVTRHLASRSFLPFTADWIDQLSVDRYLPIMGLIDDEERRSLHLQLGVTPHMARQFRVERCRASREYLRQMDADFKGTCMAVKVIIVQSQQDRPDLVLTLARYQITFAYGMMIVRFRLMLYRYGIRTEWSTID